MQKTLRFLLSAIAIVLIISTFNAKIGYAQNVVQDEKLRKIINKHLYNRLDDASDITSSSIQTLKQLTIPKNSGVKNLSGLESATELSTITIDFSGNNITSLNNISNLRKLTSLEITDVPTNNLLNSLSSLNSLKTLSISGTQITDISSISSLTNLTELNITNTKVTTLDSLKRMINLEILRAYGSEITDLTPISNIISLKSLNVSNTNVDSLSPISRLTNLNTLNISKIKARDFSNIENLRKLEYLSISDNDISNVSFVKNLTNLKSLDMSKNKISDLSSIADIIKNLTTNTNIENYSTKFSDQNIDYTANNKTFASPLKSINGSTMPINNSANLINVGNNIEVVNFYNISGQYSVSFGDATNKKEISGTLRVNVIKNTGTLYTLDVSYYDETITNKYVFNSKITLNAKDKSSDKKIFSRWESNDITIDNPTNKTLNFDMPSKNVRITAIYENLYSISLTNAKITNKSNVTSGTFKVNEQLTLTPDTNTDIHKEFSHWQVSGITLANNKLNPLTIQMPASNVTVKAIYNDKLYNLNIVDGSIKDTGTQNGSFIFNTPITIKYDNKINSDMLFNKWISNDMSVSNPTNKELSFNMPGNNVTLTATYDKIYPVTVNDGSIISQNLYNSKFKKDDKIQIKATDKSSEKKIFDHWESNDITITNPNEQEITFSMIDKNVSITAIYSNIPKYTLTAVDATINSTNQSVSEFYAGDSITLNPINKSSSFKEFFQWSSNDINIDDVTNKNLSFNMPNKNVTVTANYQDILFSVTVNDGIITSSNVSNLKYKVGEKIQIRANDKSSEHKSFVRWTSKDNKVVFTDPNSIDTSFDMIGENVEISAIYDDIPKYMLTAVDATINSTNQSIGKFYVGESIILNPIDKSSTKEVFEKWEANGIGLQNEISNPLSIQMPTNDVSITAKYIKSIVPTQDIQITTDSILIAIGENYNINAIVLPDDASNKNITYVSDDENIATVKNGIVNAISTGKTSIRLYLDNIEKIINIYVEDNTPKKVYHTITINNGNGINTISALSRQSITINADKKDNYEFSYFSSDKLQITDKTNPTLTFVMIDEDITIDVNYVEIQNNTNTSGGSSYFSDENYNDLSVKNISENPTVTIKIQSGKNTIDIDDLNTIKSELDNRNILKNQIIKNINKSTPYYCDINFIIQNKLMIGITLDNFDEDGILNKAMLAQILLNMSEVDEIKSVNLTDTNGKWYENAVNFVVTNNLMNAKENVFDAEEQITKEELIKVLNNYIQKVVDDGRSVSDEVFSHIQKDRVTRGEMARTIRKFALDI